MLNIHNFNPEILPSTKSSKSADHHKLITGAILATIGMLIIGGLYWWMGQKKIVEVPVPVPTAGDDGRVVLSPQQSQQKLEALSNINSEQVKLTPEEKKKKEAILKAGREI